MGNSGCDLFTFDSSDGVLAMLRLVMRGLPLGAVLHRVLVHAGVSGQQTHVVLFAVVANGSAVPQRLLRGRRGGGDRSALVTLFFFGSLV